MPRSAATLMIIAASLLAGCETLEVEATHSVRETYVPPKAETLRFEPPLAPAANAPEAKPAVPRTYGQLRRPNAPVTPLATIAANPTRYEGRQVHTEGVIKRVCQKKGCWLELADATGTRVFVPITSHAFSVPIKSVGGEALVEGTVHRRERSHAERKHLKADGAGNNIPSLSIEANAVVIR